MLSINPCFPIRGREKGGKGRETYKLNIKIFTNNTNNIKNYRNNAQYTKLTLSFPELGAGCWRPTSSCQAAPGSPGLASAAGRNWTQECTDLSLDQDRRQNNEQGPFQKAAMDEESETLVIPQLQTMTCMAWNTALVNIGSPVLSAPPCKCDHF